MSDVPVELLYTEEHEWVKLLDDGYALLGITDFAAHQLGSIVYVELPEVGASFDTGDLMGEIESTKSVGELFSPLPCEVVEVNEELQDAPELVNDSPYEKGWIAKIKLTGATDHLLDATTYAGSLA